MKSPARSALAEQLLAAGLKPTPQRLQIAQVLLDKPQHLSADQVLQRVRRKGGSISKATVYNTLRAFADHGLLRAIVVDPERVFFDSTPGPHHHFFDVSSHALHDIPGEGVRVEGLPPLPAGTESAGVDVVVRIRPKRGGR
jgi:Fur family iron response transcriptional regulator